MKSAQYTQTGGPEVLEIVESTTPEPGPNEVRISVAAAGVNAFDGKVRRGDFAPHMPGVLPAGTGMEASGTISAVGPGVTSAAVGDLVYGKGKDTYADEAVLSAWAAVPEGVAARQAAGWTVAAETSVRVLEELSPAAGATLVISGASGGVGMALVQIAAARGFRVIGTASERNHDRLRGLGAVPVLYGEGFGDRVRALAPEGVGGGIDVAGAGVLDELVELTGDAGRVITIADFSGSTPGVLVSDTGRFYEEAFAEVAGIQGFGLPVAQEYPLAESGRAQEQVLDGHAGGKVIVAP